MIKFQGLKRQYSVLGGSYLLSLGGLSLIDGIFNLNLSWPLLVGMTAIFHILYFLATEYRKKPLLYISIAIGCLCFYWIYKQFEWQFISRMGDAFRWLINYDGSEENYIRGFAVMVGMLLLMGLSLFFYIGNQFFIVKMILAATNIVILISLCVLGFQGSKLGITSLLTYDFMVLAEYMHQKQYGKAHSETYKVMLTLIPICLLIGVIAVCLPSKETPLSWQWIFNLYHRAEEFCEDVAAEMAFTFGGASDEFGLAFEGIKDENALGGNIASGNQLMLSVSTNSMPHQSIYLAGAYKDTYTGESWKATDEKKIADIPEYKLNTYEMLYGMGKGPIDGDGEMLLKQNGVTITYEKIRTRSLFLPLESSQINELEEKGELKWTPNYVHFPKRRKEKQYFKADFVELNRSNPYFQECLNSLEGATYDENQELNTEKLSELYKGNIRDGVLKDFLKQKGLFKTLKQRQQKIYDLYTQLPDELPERVKTLTQEITKNADSRYDKLKAIEQYLKQYEYTKTPGKLPEGKDFVDYFLFEQKAGYCTYFATSMAVMARTIGIPTRYVEGFLVDGGAKSGSYKVYADKAHAWVEAYFDGIGWINFEPSAGYEIQYYSSWKVASTQSTTEISAVTMPSVTPEEEINDEPLELEDMAIEQAKKFQKYQAIMGRMIVVILILLIGSIIFQILRYRRRYKKSQLDEKYRMRFKEMIYLLGKMDLCLGPNETLLQFKERAVKQSEKLSTLIENIVSTYSKARYSPKEISSDQDKEMQALYSRLWQFMVSEYGKPKCYWWKLRYALWGYKKF